MSCNNENLTMTKIWNEFIDTSSTSSKSWCICLFFIRMVSSISRIRLLSSDSILPRPPKTISFQENIAGGFYKHNTHRYVGYKSFCNILYLEMMLMTLPLRLYHPRPLPYHHLLKFLVEDLTPHPCMKIARYIGIINVITAFILTLSAKWGKIKHTLNCPLLASN